MRSIQVKLSPWRAIPLVMVLLGAACSGSETISGEVAAEQSAAADQPADPTTVAAVAPTAAAAEPESTVRGAWIIEIQGGRVVSSPDETICLKLPGGTFTVNGGGDNGFGGQFFFYLSNEGGNAFTYEINGNATVGVEPEIEGVLDINYDADSGATTVTSSDLIGVTIAIAGIC